MRWPAGKLLLRDQLQDAALGTVRHQVERAVRSVTDVADPFATRLQILEEALLADDLLALHREADQVRASEAADEQAVLPGGEQLAGVERHPARRDVRIPVVDRLFHPGLLLDAAGDRSALVLDAVGDRRPAVVLALLRDVHL